MSNVFMKENISITDLAEKLKVSQDSLRKWQTKYKLSVPKNQKGSRYYSPALVETFSKIKELKDQNKKDDEILVLIGPISSTKLIEPIPKAENNIIDDIKLSIATEIKSNNEMAYKLASVSNELGFMRGQLEYTREENQDLKLKLDSNLEVEKKSLQLFNSLVSKEKEIIVLNSKLDIAMVEARNKDYIIDSLRNDNQVLKAKLVELEAKLIEVSKLGFIDKIRFKYEK